MRFHIIFEKIKTLFKKFEDKFFVFFQILIFFIPPIFSITFFFKSQLEMNHLKARYMACEKILKKTSEHNFFKTNLDVIAALNSHEFLSEKNKDLELIIKEPFCLKKSSLFIKNNQTGPLFTKKVFEKKGYQESYYKNNSVILVDSDDVMFLINLIDHEKSSFIGGSFFETFHLKKTDFDNHEFQLSFSSIERTL